MANRNRQRGDYFERRTRDALEDCGWLVVRSAGSLGPADLVALASGYPPYLISCKLHGRLTPAEQMTLIATAITAGALPVLASRIRPGWAALDRVHPMGRERLDELHFPPRKPRPRTGRPAEPETDPAQLTIYDAFITE